MNEPLPAWDPLNLAAGAAMVLGFVLFLFVLSRAVRGTAQEGAKLEDGSRKRYVLNGLTIFLLTMGTLAACQVFGFFSLSVVYRHFWGLFVAANVLSFVLTGVLFVTGKNKPGSHRHGQDARPSGSARGDTATADASASPIGLIQDLWYGVELNPDWLGIDIKLFSYKPSLIGLAVLNASFAVVQFETHGFLTTQMICYQAFTFIYVFNYFQFEYGMLYTWDIVAERFGFMLVWGDYAFVPFMYSIVGWYLVDQTDDIPLWAAGLLALTFALGLWIFRGANQQKDEFKRDPRVKIWGKPAETLGGKILVSGFWGIGRKLNYTGEIMVYASFTLLSGFDSFVPYLLPTWLLCLLVHRAWRDDKRCRQKYGALWEQYCRRATFKMVPFVY